MKTLLISSIPPCSNYTAGIVLLELCKTVISKNELAVVTIANQDLSDAIIDKTINIPNIRLIRPKEDGIVIKGLPKTIFEPISRIREKERELKNKKLIQQIVAFAKANNVDRIWVHLESPWLIRMAIPVSESLNLPLYTMVFDDPCWYLDCVNMDRWTRSEVNKLFERAIQKSVCCATASIPMAEEYAQKFGVRTQVIQHCFDLSLSQTPLSSLPDRDTFRIGYAGKIYAMDAWHSFIKLLDSLNWSIFGRKIIVRYVGPTIHLHSKVPCNYEYFGWNSQADVVKLLSECDMLYCSYPFDPDLKEICRLSFPSKIPSYLTAARPILFHGPEYSSAVRFFRETKSGLVVTDLNESALFNEIKRLFLEPELYGTLCSNALISLKEHFCHEVMKKNFLNFLK